MMKSRYILATLACIAANTIAGPIPVTEADVGTALARAGKVFGVLPSAHVTANSDDLRTDATGIIEVGLAAVEQKLNGVSSANRSLLLNYILAHEAWHVRQLAEPGAPAVASMSTSDRRLSECSADVMAAYFVVRDGSEPLLANPQGLENIRRLVWYLHSTEAFHPLGHQRDAAVTLGFRLSMIELLQQRKHLDDSEERALVEMRKMSGWNGIDKTPVIAQRLCMQITQYDDTAAKNVRVTEASHEFNPTLEFPFVHYAVSFRNSGRRAVQVTYTPKVVLAVGVCKAARVPEDEFQAYQLFSAETRVFVVPPRGTHHLMGMLPWLPTPDRCPRIDFDPRFSRTMISYRFSDDVQPVPTCVSQQASQADPTDRAFGVALRRIANEADSRFAALRTGSSMSFDDRTIYDANITLPGVKNLSVSVSRNGESYVSGDVYDGPDAGKAAEAFRQLREQLVHICPLTVGDWEETADDEGGEFEIKRFSDTSSVSAAMYETSKKQFVVYLRINQILDDSD